MLIDIVTLTFQFYRTNNHFFFYSNDLKCKDNSKSYEMSFNSNNLSAGSNYPVTISNRYLTLTSFSLIEQAGGGRCAANENENVAGIIKKKKDFSNLNNIQQTNKATIHSKKIFKKPIDKELVLAKSLFQNKLSFPIDNRLPQTCLEDLFQVFHLAKSSRKNFFDRIQKKFKRNDLFKRKIKNRLSNFYKIHGTTYNEKQTKKNLDRKLDKKVINYSIDQIPNIAAAKTFNREQQKIKTIKNPKNYKLNKQHQQVFCVCNKPNDGSIYVFCETCHQWFHPKCFFEKGHLALTLSGFFPGYDHFLKTCKEIFFYKTKLRFTMQVK